MIRFIYLFNYDEGVSQSDGEAWYLQEHVPQINQLNKWARLTELGMSLDTYKATMVDEATRIRFAASPHGNVLSGWLNISIKLDQVTDFLNGESRCVG